MLRPAKSRLSPWIEGLILSYGRPEESGDGGGSSGWLKAHVIGVGQMSLSQAQGSEGPTGLLFLSDGELQIPAILTASAWEHLQEQEERECFTSLVNATVRIQDYQLQFHMAPEQTKCRFIVSIGRLATTAAGPVKNNTPCSTTLPSVRLKICRTWRALLGPDTQQSQCEFDLSELLGEWQHDCLQAVLDDVQERLKAAASTSTSACNPETLTATGWELDRVTYKGEESFTVPMKYLLIPEDVVQQVQGPPRSGTTGGLPVASEDRVSDLNLLYSLDNGVRREDTLDSPLSNPWDIFPPPCGTSSSSDASPEATPAHADPDRSAIRTGAQIQGHNATLQHSRGELSLPPYQKVPTGVLAVDALTPSVCPDQVLEKDTERNVESGSRKSKRSNISEEEEEEINRSPPSWLFDTQEASRAEVGDQPGPGVPRAVPRRRRPAVHSDGRPFSYSYHVSGQNLQDFSGFRMADTLLSWAVKYLLVPKQTDSSVTSRDNVI